MPGRGLLEARACSRCWGARGFSQGGLSDLCRRRCLAAAPQVKSLASEQQQKADPEVEFRTARVLAQASGGGAGPPGLALLLRLLLDSELPEGAPVAGLLRLLHACSQVGECRRSLLGQGAVSALLHHANQQLKALLGPAAGPGAAPRAAGWAPPLRRLLLRPLPRPLLCLLPRPLLHLRCTPRTP